MTTLNIFRFVTTTYLQNANFRILCKRRVVDTMPTIQFRTDKSTKEQSNEIFNTLGITMSDAINMFLRQSILHGGLPFELKIPKYNKTTLNTLVDMERSKGKGIHGKNVRAALADLREEDGDNV
jgi:DNA-damage-inducible protein J